MDGLDVQAPDDSGAPKSPKAKFGNDKVVGTIGAPAAQRAPKAAPKGKFGGDPVIAKVTDQPSATSWAPAQSTAGDIGKSFASGVISGAEGLPQMPGVLANLAVKGLNKLGIGATDEDRARYYAEHGGEANRPYNIGDVGNMIAGGVEKLTGGGGSYKPTTTLGEYAKTAGEFAPAALGGPAGLGRRIVQSVAIPTVVGTTAGKIADDLAPGSGEIVKAVTGAAAGGLSHLTTPRPNAAIAGAAERIGVNVPRGVATDSALAQRGSQFLRNMPGAGEPLVRAGDETIAQLSEAAQKAGTAAGGSSKLAAGSTAKDSITNWITGKSAKNVSAAYDRVDKLVNPNVTTDLANTRNTVGQIASERAAAHLPDGQGSAVRQVLDAAQTPGGLTHAGIQKLRTSVGEMLDSGVLPADTSGAELKRIYGALTEDLGQSAANAGGAAGKAAWEAANNLAKTVAGRREALAKIVGVKGDVHPEAVFDRIAQMASNKGNANLLAKARQVMGSDWSEVAGTVVKRMGLDKSGQFSPARFVSDYGNMSPQGKAILFNQPGGSGALRQALDDISTVSQRLKDMGKFGNPSGTAQNVAGIAEIAGLIKDPLGTIAGIVGGRAIASALARPATAASTAKFMSAYGRYAASPGPAAVAGLSVAARNLAGTFESHGISISPDELTRQLGAGGSSTQGGGGRHLDVTVNPHRSQ